jgi:hypothetical protein
MDYYGKRREFVALECTAVNEMRIKIELKLSFIKIHRILFVSEANNRYAQ